MTQFGGTIALLQFHSGPSEHLKVPPPPSNIVLMSSPFARQRCVIYMSMVLLHLFQIFWEHKVVFGQHERPEDCAVRL